MTQAYPIDAERARRRVIIASVGATTLSTLAASMIWGVLTLFMMEAGLDIFDVMIVGAGTSFFPILFEIPTGVVADTVGRRASYLASLVILIASTLLLLTAGRQGWGLPGFMVAASALGIGWTFQTGAVDAWLVDALDHTGWEGTKERVFAWNGIAYEASLLVGTITGGVLGQIDLALPFVVRTVILVVCLIFVFVMVHDLGFERRPLSLRTLGHEMSGLLRTGIQYGWNHSVIRPLMFESALVGAFYMFSFGALQPFLLDLLGRNLIWVAATGTAVGSLAGIAGNVSAGRIMRGPNGRRGPARVLAFMAVAAAASVFGAGLIGIFTPPEARGFIPVLAVTGLWMVMAFANGVAYSVRRGFINEYVPSSHRATVLSFDAVFMDAGATVGQPGLGWISRAFSIPAAWMVGSLLCAWASQPLLQADRADKDIRGIS